MQKANGALKDIFSTILSDTPPKATSPAPARIVVHGDGNVIALGGTVHYVQAPPRRTAPAKGAARGNRSA